MLHYPLFGSLPPLRETVPSMPSSIPRVMEPFPELLGDVLAGLDCVLFRREMSAAGEIAYGWMSDNARAVFGFAPGEITVTSRGALNAVHWADRDPHLEAILRSAASGEHCRETFRIVTGGGETRWLRESSAPRKAADGIVVWDGAWMDVSPGMRAETQFQTVMDHAEDVILTLDAGRTIDWANAAAERLFGYPDGGLAGTALAVLAPDLDGAGGFGSRETLARRRDGTRFPFEMTISEVRADGRLSLIVIGRDIIRRKIIEGMLEETELRLRTIAANLPGVMFQRVRESDGNVWFPYVSEGIEEILGRRPREIVDDPALFTDATLPLDRERRDAAMKVSASTMLPLREDIRVVGIGGRTRWLRGQSRPRRRDDAIMWDGILLDVTEEIEDRIKAEAAVRQSEERLRLAFAAASLGIVVVALDGTIQQCNPAFRAICGAGDKPLEGTSLFAYVERDVLPASERIGQGTFRLDYTPHLADGVERHWRITGTRFAATPEALAPSLLVLIEDITDASRAAAERRQLELALQDGQKLEALGRLAGGVAHELNNMLGPILMGAEMMERGAGLDARNRERCARIIEAAKHGRDIVRNVLGYCRKESRTLSRFDLVPVFHQFAALAVSVLPSSVSVQARAELETAAILGEAGQIQQVLLNLANNARDAMAGQGTLTLTLRPLAPYEMQFRRSGLMRATDAGLPHPFTRLDPDRAHVELRVADTGCGMRAETAGKIFDPFFTTKPVGQGTGLGLSVVQGIIKGMGGAIAVESVPGQGTAFRIALPRVG